MVHTLSKAHKLATGQDLEKTVLTCTTDVRFFELYHGIEATCYGPEAKNIHGYHMIEQGAHILILTRLESMNV